MGLGFPGLDLESVAEGKVQGFISKFSSLSDSMLIKIINEGEKKFGNKKFPLIFIADLPHEFYQAKAVVSILRDRYGNEYIEKLTSIPQPKNFLQQVKYFFIGRV